ncbi:MAG: LysR family transcriptional regulator [Alphaproteobacteria bacterium]|nr:LysR family transcriptional regulator [Alphaproteobacteria bacterium]MCW5741668.1 LysR family transcriptional regulator [Alphaproteobacteria bacterium]
MDASDLRVFEAVARLGGMNRAAQALNTVQSNVTARVRALEAELGAPLFDRHSRGVALTAAGQRLLPYATKVQHLLDDAARAARDDGSPSGRLTVGTLETTAALRLAEPLARFAAEWPAVDLVVRTGTTTELIDMVLERRVEGAFVAGPVDHPELRDEPVFREELAIFSGRDLVSLDELSGRRELKLIVLRAGCSYRQRLEHVLARRGVVSTRLLEFGTLEAIFNCVAAGIGITLLPRQLAGGVWSASRVAVHQLPPNEAMVRTVFIRRRDAFMSSALSAFVAAAGVEPECSSATRRRAGTAAIVAVRNAD